MISPHFDEVILECDNCLESPRFRFWTLQSALETSQLLGWTRYREGNRWYDLCPNCPDFLIKFPAPK